MLHLQSEQSCVTAMLKGGGCAFSQLGRLGWFAGAGTRRLSFTCSSARETQGQVRRLLPNDAPARAKYGT